MILGFANEIPRCEAVITDLIFCFQGTLPAHFQKLEKQIKKISLNNIHTLMEVYKGMLCPAEKRQKLKNNFGINHYSQMYSLPTQSKHNLSRNECEYFRDIKK